jgi:hypothetical protein
LWILVKKERRCKSRVRDVVSFVNCKEKEGIT